jgi:hypothetical protein
MYKVQKLSNSECCTPSSEPIRIYLALEVSIKVFLGNGYICLAEVIGTVLINSQNLKYIFPQESSLRLRTVTATIKP